MRFFNTLLAFTAVWVASVPAGAAPLQLSFTSFPPGALTGRSDAPAIVVSVEDASGAVATDSEAQVTLTLAADPGGGVLRGTTAVTAVGGVARFVDLSLDRSGAGYVLLASARGMPSVTSALFSFSTPADPHEVVGYGCSSAEPTFAACLFPLLLARWRRRRRPSFLPSPLPTAGMRRVLPALLFTVSALVGCSGGTDGVSFPSGGPPAPSVVCSIRNGGCDPRATCASDSSGRAICTCMSDSGYEGDGVTCTDVLGTLNGLRWELPCSGTLPTNPGGCYTRSAPVVVSTSIGGVSSRQYSIALRFRGVVEKRVYTGGSNDGALWQIGGDPPGPAEGQDIYKLEISAPPQVYYLNRNWQNDDSVGIIDYTKTVFAVGGAVITLTADPIDGSELNNHSQVYGAGPPFVIPGVPPAPAAYDGQFIQMDIVR